MERGLRLLERTEAPVDEAPTQPLARGAGLPGADRRILRKRLLRPSQDPQVPPKAAEGARG
jgi:hypothetical protein